MIDQHYTLLANRQKSHTMETEHRKEKAIVSTAVLQMGIMAHIKSKVLSITKTLGHQQGNANKFQPD